LLLKVASLPIVRYESYGRLREELPVSQGFQVPNDFIKTPEFELERSL